MQEGRKEGREEGRKGGRKEGRKEGGTEGRKDGRKQSDRKGVSATEGRSGQTVPTETQAGPGRHIDRQTRKGRNEQPD